MDEQQRTHKLEHLLLAKGSAWDGREGPLIVALFSMIVIIPGVIYVGYQLFRSVW